MDPYILVPIIFLIVVVVGMILFWFLRWVFKARKTLRRNKELDEMRENVLESGKPISVEKWLSDVQARKTVFNCPGVYILTNDITHECYVGQAKNLGERVRQHFRSDAFMSKIDCSNWDVRIVAISTYDRNELNHLEREYIAAFSRDYSMLNRTRGNR